MKLTLRLNFQNIFNRTQMANPTATNPVTPTTCTGGTGTVCTNSGNSRPAHRRIRVHQLRFDLRAGLARTLEMRFQF